MKFDDISRVDTSLTHEEARASHWTRVWVPLGAGLFIAALAGSAIVVPQLHFILIVACVAAFHRLRPDKKQWWQCLAGGVLVLAYFAVIIATMLPR